MTTFITLWLIPILIGGSVGAASYSIMLDIRDLISPQQDRTDQQPDAEANRQHARDLNFAITG
jgi:hypothetical protein